MGYCCFCIPLKVYGLVIACLQIIGSAYNFIHISLNSVPENEITIVLLQFLLDIVSIIAAGFLIVGILQRRYEYFAPFMILTAICISLICLAMFAVLLVSPVLFAFLWVDLIVTCLITFPIYILYMEFRNENMVRFNV